VAATHGAWSLRQGTPDRSEDRSQRLLAGTGTALPGLRRLSATCSVDFSAAGNRTAGDAESGARRSRDESSHRTVEERSIASRSGVLVSRSEDDDVFHPVWRDCMNTLWQILALALAVSAVSTTISLSSLFGPLRRWAVARSLYVGTQQAGHLAGARRQQSDFHPLQRRVQPWRRERRPHDQLLQRLSPAVRTPFASPRSMLVS